MIRLPTGEEDDFQGTGAFEVSPSFYASMLIADRVHPHVNVAIDVRPEEAERSQARYGIGADIDIIDRLGISFALLGRSEFSESARFRDTAFLHANGQQLPLLGLEFDRKDYFDASLGLRAVIWRDVMLFADVLRETE